MRERATVERIKWAAARNTRLKEELTQHTHMRTYTREASGPLIVLFRIGEFVEKGRRKGVV